MENFNSQIQKFWEEVQRLYDPLQKETDLSYYVFQTAFRFRPKLMIIGINPGGGYGSEKYLVNKISEKGKFQNMYVDWMYYENPNKTENEWFNTLCSVFDYPNNPAMKRILETCVGTNCYYLNTGSVKTLNKRYEVSRFKLESKTLVKKLIGIIQPQKILTLGDIPFNLVRDNRVIPISINEVNSLKTSFSGVIPVCNIPNPSKINKNQLYKEPKLTDFQNGLAKLLL